MLIIDTLHRPYYIVIYDTFNPNILFFNVTSDVYTVPHSFDLRGRAMQKLTQGLQHYKTKVFGSQRELFERLTEGQSPEVLFITCSDSRINPNLLTQTEPGELFILRNAGNLVPPYGALQGGEAATIEFAVAGVGVKALRTLLSVAIATVVQ